MKKKTAKAPANIAFIKYWGKKEEKLRLPVNNSLSMNLSNVFTITTVEFSSSLKEDRIEMEGGKLGEEGKQRIIAHLDRIRARAGIKVSAKVKTKNNFPQGVGVASSASGFAALTLAATAAAGLRLSSQELSVLARQGSGSACRSIPDGFVEWKAGNSSPSSFAYSLFPPHYWEIRDIIAIIGEAPKKVSSSEGHTLAESSPFYKARVKGMKTKIKMAKKALKEKDFRKFGEILEEEAINMHAVMMTSSPPLFYWLPKTVEVILAVWDWREEGLPVYFTIDAGPNVHLICQKKDEKEIEAKLREIKGVKKIIFNKPARGAYLLRNHLF